jgi:hypothetical protein
MDKPLNPEMEFKHISVCAVHILVRLMARKAVALALRNEGVNALHVMPRDINDRARAYLRDHPEVWREAIAVAHRIDEKEGQRKERQRLRRAELAKLRASRSVYRTGSANAGTEMTQVFSTTSAIFSASRLLIDG